ncbi:MAG: lysylphosphatidylglycerol synthase domain-containing protein, partial [Acetobacteraceae bacterium]
MAAGADGRSGGWRRHLPALLGIALLVAALLGVRRSVRKLDLASVSAALAAIPSAALALAFAWTLASYAIMALYDRLGTLYAGARVGFGRTALASFTAYALSHNLGFAAVSGAAVRYRLYAQWGVPAAEIARIVAFCSITFGLGGLTLGGAILLGAPHAVPALGGLLSGYALRLLGAAMLGVVGAYATLSRSLGSLRIFGQEITLPGLRLALAQIGIATADVAVTAAILHALLPPAPGLSFARLLALYLAAYAAGLIASLPGGIGVFDGALLLGLSPYLGAPEILGAILIFRLYYYVIPLVLAGLVFAANEVIARLGRPGPAPGAATIPRRTPARAPGRAPGRAMVRAPDFAAAAATGLVALVGALLVGIDVVAARLPPGRPIRGLGLSHLALLAGDFLPSLIGAGLMILSLGLSRRVRLAWSGTLALLGIAFLLTLAQGLSWFIPAALALAALLLAPLRPSFYRDVKLFADPLRASNAVPLFALAVCLMLLASFARREPGFAAASLWHLLTDPAAAPQSRLGI